MLRKTLLTVAVLLLLYGADLRAQSNMDEMHASAYVYKPLVLTLESNLNFGLVTVGPAGGTVVISQAGNRTSTSDVGLVSSAHSSGRVAISAQENMYVTINFPSTATLYSGLNSLDLVFNPSLGSTEYTGETGLLQMNIGGTVTIPPGAPIGEYSGSVQLSVVYY